MNILDNINDEHILDLNEYRRSPSPGVEASRPKYQITTPNGEIYFKFQLTNNEICAEIVACQIAANLNIPAAKTVLAKYKETVGIASYDVGMYEEPDDSLSYSIKDFLKIDGFIQMCLFDYLIMAVHYGYFDADHFMFTVSSAFYAENESQNRHDDILKYLLRYNAGEIKNFTEKLNKLPELKNPLLEKLYTGDFKHLKELYEKRLSYMLKKVGEFSER